MSPPSDRLQYRRLHVPREDHAALVDPPWEAMAGQIDENLRLHGQYDYDFQGRSLRELSREARRGLLVEARRWTQTYRDVDLATDVSEGPIFLAGHQPQLVHPGVWFKNFALDRLARRHHAVAVNLLVDNDTVKDTAIRVPGGSIDQPDVADVALDAAGPAVPYEERSIVDRACFETFGHRAAERISPLVPDTMVEDYWSLAVQRSRETDNLGACLAQSRHQMEGRWGLQTLEAPSSRLCRLEAFAWFVAHLLARLDQFREVHNATLGEYRELHRIRTAAQPVPDLAADGEWLEAPFWIWTTADPRRRPLFARRLHDRIELGDRQSLRVELPLTSEGTADRAVARLMELAGEGVKIRCRTLTNTLFVRLMLGDVFLHGIGGAKYDQVTDAIVERYFGLRPPHFFTLSATLLLPIPRAPAAVEDDEVFQRRLREMTHHPERFLDGVRVANDGELAALLAEKTQWLQTPKTIENARARDGRLRWINAALQPWLESERQRWTVLREEAAGRRQTASILTWREYAACLYSESSLRDGLPSLLG